jgi:phage gpG-like protein
VAHVIVAGVREFGAALDRVVAAQRAATRQATAKLLHMIEAAAKEQLRTSSHRRNEPTPSAPGEPPSLVSGNLRRGVTVTGPEAVGATAWRGEVGPTAVYGRIQELGGITGAHGSRLPARPYMQPAWDQVEPLIAATYRAAWQGALRLT